MGIKNIELKDKTLDPQDWTSMRALGHKMIDDMMDYLEGIKEEKIWRPTPDHVKDHFKSSLPQKGSNIEDIYQEFKQYVLPYNKGNVHPRFWSWVQGTGTPMGMLADLLASGMNPNTAIGDHAAMYLEAQVIEWCKEMFDFPEEGSGILLSGATMANIHAIMVARNATMSASIRKEGLRGQKKQLTAYGSVETHSCVDKGIEAAGIGLEYFRKISCHDDYTINLEELESTIIRDIEAGFHPFCIIATAGTVNTGAIDPISELVIIARRYNIWLHVDGAFGALARLVPEYYDSLEGIKDADSLAFDFHKWMYVPYEAACLLVKDKDIHRSAFNLQPSYLLTHERGLAAGPDPVTNYGMELSRGFKALKIWMSLKEHGIDRYAEMIEQNIQQCRYLASEIIKNEDLELLAEVNLNIVCFRYQPGSIKSVEEMNALNKEILMRLHEQAVGAPSYTMLDGKYAIRVAHVNHRTRKLDFDDLVEGVLRIGKQVEEEFA